MALKRTSAVSHFEPTRPRNGVYLTKNFQINRKQSITQYEIMKTTIYTQNIGKTLGRAFFAIQGQMHYE